MNFVHSKSEECTKGELDLFSVPPTQVSLEKGLWIDHKPVSSVSDRGPITFLSPRTEDYEDLAKTILVVRAKVIKATVQELQSFKVTDTILMRMKNGHREQFPIQFVPTSRCVFERKTSDPSRRDVCLSCLLGNALDYGPAAKQSQLTAAMFYKDTAGKMDTADPTLHMLILTKV